MERAQTSQLTAMTESAAVGGNPKMVTGLFKDSEAVERAYEIVCRRSYGMADINVVMSDDTRRRYFCDDRKIDIKLGRKAAEGGEMGGPMGATTIGMVIPALIAAGVVALPGLGFVLGGPVAVAMIAAGAAGLTGGLIVALSDWGIPEERAKQYETAIHDGGILMAVRPRSDEDARHFKQQWKAIGGKHVHS